MKNLILAIVILLSSVCVGHCNVSITSVQKGLIGHWELDGTTQLKDLSMIGSDGTGNGSIATGGATDNHGQANKATTFDASDDFISVADNSAYNTTSARTICLWVKTTSTASGGNTIFARIQDASPFPGFTFNLGRNTAGRLAYYAGAWYGSTSATYNDGSWHHIAVVHNGTNLKFYKDGVEDGSRTVPNPANYDTDILIGKERASTPRLFNGTMKGVMFYNRALSVNEIKYLAGAYRPKLAIGSLQKGLVLHLPMDGNNGIKDLSTFYNSAAKSGTITIGEATDRHGQANGSTNFIASNEDGIIVTHNASISPETMSAFTWINSDTWSEATANCIFVKRPGNTAGYFFFVLTGTGFINIDVNNAVLHRFSTGYAPPIGQWLHLGFTYDGHYIRFYVNGSLYGTSTDYNSIIASTTANLYIGKQAGDTYNFDGKMADLRIYNRVLSVEEIKSLYNSYNPNLVIN